MGFYQKNREKKLCGKKKLVGYIPTSPYFPPGLEYTQYLALIQRAIAALLPGFSFSAGMTLRNGLRWAWKTFLSTTLFTLEPKILCFRNWNASTISRDTFDHSLESIKFLENQFYFVIYFALLCFYKLVCLPLLFWYWKGL